jgi:hypothetical protein
MCAPFSQQTKSMTFIAYTGTAKHTRPIKTITHLFAVKA